MNVSAWSIRNPIPAAMLFVMLTLAGLFSFKSMKVQNFPDLDVPNITVVASLPGAAPNQLENDVARKIENSLASLQGLKHIYTKVQDGTVSITAEFRIEKNTQEALDDVRSAVAKVRGDLPTDLREPIVNKLELAGGAVLAYTVSSDKMDDEAISWFVDNDVAKLLLSVPGVGAINRVGGVNREVQILLDPLKLQSLGATAADISRQLSLVQIESAGGRADIGGSQQPLRTLSAMKSAEELAALELSLSDGRRIRLDQIATVKDTIAEPTAAAFLDGKPVVGFEVARSKGASEVEVGHGVRAKLKALQVARPDLAITESFDFVTPVEEEFNASMTLLYEGAILAVLVVWLFLRDFRATVVSAVALPLSAIPAFIGMHYMGFTINVVTLLAMSLVVGILVDDAIVEVENIVRHMRMGKTPYQAAMEASDEIGMAVIATTFTLIAVFLPTAFMSGIPGKFFKQFGWTAALAVFASLIVARALTPMMAAYILKPVVTAKEQPAWARSNRFFGAIWAWMSNQNEPGWLDTYQRWAAACIRHRWLTLIGAVAFFMGSLALIPLLPQGFVPADDNSQTQVYLELPPGSTLAQTVATSERARVMVNGVKHVRSVYTTIGSGSAGSDPFAPQGAQESRKAALTIQLDPRGQRPRKQVIESQLREVMSELPGVRYKVGLGGSGEKYILTLTGSDANALSTAARAIERDLRTINGVGSIQSSAALVRTEIIVTPDLQRAADLGVTSSAIAETLRIATVGDYDSALPKLNLPQRQVPIVVKLDSAARENLDVLGRLSVPGARGPVMLSQVATLTFGGGPAVIDRYDRSRNINFEVELAGIPLGDMKTAVDALPSIKNLPPGVQVLEIGDAEVQGELFASFGLAMLTGVLCIYIVLVLLFKAFLMPVTILPALLMSFGGAFVALLLTNKSFSMPSLIGLVMLMGVASKNSILLVEYAIEARRQRGMPRLEAILDACHKRARPIVMTTIAMVAGMLPVAVGSGAADGSFRSPMAVAVIGGLVTSTLLSLLVVPAVFTMVDDLSILFARLVGRKVQDERAHERDPNALSASHPA
ncbi:MAG: efflux RND transporter permease subunit [Gammaproteobacteria bacterium]|jgi:multidrug efflux pump subunit AcrB|uniref:efflux RND transporter permease subunit n=1 Tax=Hydrogenophaga sp. TaxID=1904254 RepID=UPI000CBC5963|nr:efflux RND transporter permease subunit [Hydrogenophaga sp.]MBU4180992.1 efflux RND transporter permease subunit [Gammaproteobacteria bacterium]MBU4282565.1 efflux RND transporter permease subunit [Gammaproteobacteria bacterium]MCG2658292.1 efflux RND transporter permease subunit [Hydrogenophaga sp.]PKO75748.1 MAG: RND transporter [Betaproteobacteria bacterium HGW-Betaproteobacteria-15]